MGWLIDTNVLSETRRRTPDARVMAWLSAHGEEHNFISVLTLGEIIAGVEAKKLSDRPQGLAIERWMEGLKERYSARLLSVTPEIAEIWSGLSPGQRLPETDGLIAATASAHRLILVARNVRDFRRAGVPLLNPWEYKD